MPSLVAWRWSAATRSFELLDLLHPRGGGVVDRGLAVREQAVDVLEEGRARAAEVADRREPEDLVVERDQADAVVRGLMRQEHAQALLGLIELVLLAHRAGGVHH